MARGAWAKAATGAAPAPLHRLPTATLIQVLAEIREVVLIVTADRVIRYSNKAADRLLAGKDPLQARRGRLEAASPALGQALGRAIDGACAKVGREVVILRRATAPPVVVAVSCIDDVGRQALLVASDPRVEVDLVAAPLRSCFGLTQSEAEVAAALAVGDSNSEVAERRGVSVNTIRTQVKTIAGKLGCSRQSQIAAIVRSLPLAD